MSNYAFIDRIVLRGIKYSLYAKKHCDWESIVAQLCQEIA
jgi:hypothetical protein